MKKRFSWLILITAVIITAALTYQLTYLVVYNRYRQELNDSIFSSYQTLEAVDNAYNEYYYGELDKETLEEGLIAGYILGTGDKYGVYMDAEETEAFTKDTSGENVGIGISVIASDTDDAIKILRVNSSSPAEKAGILPGDLIIKVGEESVSDIGYNEALEKMQGKEGSIAEFTVLRGNQTLSYSVERAVVTQDTVIWHMNSDNVTGVIRIEEFDAVTPKQFKTAIDELCNSGAQCLIFDVRNNPGGTLESVVEILDVILPKGPVIRIQSKNGEVETLDSDEEFIDMPMAVLVNENTASAAELFAAAIKDYDAGIIVGKTTFGKGSMQTVVPLINGASLRLTFRVYMPPYSESYEGVGVVPDITVEQAEDVKDISLYELNDENDTQLVYAINELNK